MNIELLKTKPIWQMTGEEFLALNNFSAENLDKDEKIEIDNTHEYLYGIKGICEIMGCSIAKANRVKKSGILDDAIIQDGRSIIIDKNKALQILRKRTKIKTSRR